MIKISMLFALFGVSCAARAEVVKACDVGSGPTIRVEVVREAPIADTHIYLIRHDGKVSPIFADAENSRGFSVRVDCVGRKIHALVLSGEFTSNSVQGFVMTYDPSFGTPGRLNFAEKTRPRWIYLSKSQTMVVIPTDGLGETTKPYVAYRNATGSNDGALVEGADQVPELEGYEKVDLVGAHKFIRREGYASRTHAPRVRD
jgi:hypothetical protein